MNTLIGVTIYIVGSGLTAGFICHLSHDDDWNKFAHNPGPSLATLLWPIVLPLVIFATLTIQLLNYPHFKRERKLAAEKEIERILQGELTDD